MTKIFLQKVTFLINIFKSLELFGIKHNKSLIEHCAFTFYTKLFSSQYKMKYPSETAKNGAVLVTVNVAI